MFIPRHAPTAVLNLPHPHDNHTLSTLHTHTHTHTLHLPPQA
jgi:hypothetical protein